ncbi:signal transduction histidine kinase/CheY-like chemotaxis protein [Chitinophaga terrae (ex Kim and Jung 2007)]|uniref:ATP-binding response regulator n=1 Tax=Chitinophaga terrae (ex Kim and Jung 2007) TaxID=408074 RepID=UPI00277FC6A1|nr:ATP-binding protein [Chitinophaga terrae (ex Kim and Jung 2007)]MDQ0107200.1 signal transduction histidine kinase/CheY-like chemotaxis protein [Chitinophaga terrae (ex Kim and Jung 2007)]
MNHSNVLPRQTNSLDGVNGQKRISQIVNSLSVTAASLAFILGCLFYSLTGYETIFYPAMLETCLFLAVIPLSRHTSPETGQKILFALHTLFIIFFGIVLGPASQVYLFAPFLAFCTFLVFREWKSRIAVLLACTALIVFVQVNYRIQLISGLALSAGFINTLNWIAIATATFLNCSVLYYFAKESRSRYQQLTELVDQLYKTNQSMKVYVRETTHEIRSPLNVVNSILQNYLDKADHSKRTIQIGKAHLEAVHFACQDIQLVMNNALGWSKIEAGKDEVIKSSFQFREWLSQLCETYEYLGKQRGVYVNTVISEAIPDYIHTDIAKLRSIIVNLLSNAIKFTAHHSVVTLEAFVRNEQLCCTVTDQGKGIPDEEKEHIFDPYVSSAQQQNEPIGLGLPIARYLARQLNGDLKVTDNPHASGCTFILSLPLEAAAPPELAEESIDYELMKGLKILVADDDSMNRLAFTIVLERLGIQVILADSGDEVVPMALQHKPDIIIADMVMPEVSGLEVISLLKNNKELKHIPALLVSGNCFSEVQEEVAASGADGFISKPVTAAALFQALKKNLSVCA